MHSQEKVVFGLSQRHKQLAWCICKVGRHGLYNTVGLSMWVINLWKYFEVIVDLPVHTTRIAQTFISTSEPLVEMVQDLPTISLTHSHLQVHLEIPRHGSISPCFLQLRFSPATRRLFPRYFFYLTDWQSNQSCSIDPYLQIDTEKNTFT